MCKSSRAWAWAPVLTDTESLNYKIICFSFSFSWFSGFFYFICCWCFFFWYCFVLFPSTLFCTKCSTPIWWKLAFRPSRAEMLKFSVLWVQFKSKKEEKSRAANEEVELSDLAFYFRFFFLSFLILTTIIWKISWSIQEKWREKRTREDEINRVIDSYRINNHTNHHCSNEPKWLRKWQPFQANHTLSNYLSIHL